MNASCTTHLSKAGLILAAAFLCLCVPSIAQVMTAPEPPKVEIVQKLEGQVPMDLTFVDESGDVVALKDLTQGKPTVLALVYYECPMLCGEIMQGMLKAFNDLEFTIGEEYQVITVSFNPDENHELAALKKKNMLEHYKVSAGASGWHFLTTKDENNVRALADAVGFQYQYLPSVDQYAHASGIMVLTPAGKVSRYFYGIEYPARDLRFGLIDAADGKIGSLADEILLLCYRYDPASGSYGFVVMSAIRIGGLVTVAFLGLLVGGYLFKEFRERRRATPTRIAPSS
ncbi:MAG: SCO family protein [Candidatus Hydrogenedentes bacterium]|nr:SCO family protein [Candidatus Hydrogenedentota bacterium]